MAELIDVGIRFLVMVAAYFVLVGLIVFVIFKWKRPISKPPAGTDYPALSEFWHCACNELHLSGKVRCDVCGELAPWVLDGIRKDLKNAGHI